MCNEAVDHSPYTLDDVPDHLMMQETCDAAVMEDPWLLNYVPNWFVAQGQVKTWDDYCNDNKLIKLYDGYKKRKVQKAQTKKELMGIYWHPSR